MARSVQKRKRKHLTESPEPPTARHHCTSSRTLSPPIATWIPTEIHKPGQELTSIDLPSSGTAIALSPDDKYVAVAMGAESRSKIQIYSTKSHLLVETAPVGSGFVFGASFAPNSPRQGGYILAVSKAPGNFLLWYLDHRGKLPNPGGSNQQVDTEVVEALGCEIAYSLATDHGWNEGMVPPSSMQDDINDAVRKALEQRQKQHDIPISLDGDFTALSPDGTFMITAATYDAMIWWAAISPDSRLVASGESDDGIRIWNALTGECERSFRLPRKEIRNGVFSPDSKYIAVFNGPGDSSPMVHVYELATGTQVSSFANVGRCSRAISWNSEGTLLAVLRETDDLLMWDPMKGVTRMQWSMGPYTLSYSDSIQFVDHGRKMMFTSIHGRTDVYDPLSLTLHRFAGESGTLRKAVCTRNGAFLVAMEGQVLRFWTLN
ncbi:WD40-repeat-containing domain protein [Aspergillus aurantiobrunneus]